MQKTNTNYKFINRIEVQHETTTKHIKHRTRNLPQIINVSFQHEILDSFKPKQPASNVRNNNPNQIKFRLRRSSLDMILPL